MKNMKIKYKLMTSFAIMAILAVIILSVSMYTTINLVNASMYNKTHITDPLDNMVRFSIVYGNVRSATRDLGRATADEDNARHRTTLENNMNSSVQYMKNYLDILETSGAVNREEYDAVKASYDALVEYRNIVNSKLIPAGMANDADTVFSTISVDLSPFGTAIRENVDILTTLKTDHSELSAQQASVGLRNAIITDVFLLIVVLTAVIFLAIYLSGLISKPLLTLSNFMQKAGSTGDITLKPDDVEIIRKFAQAKDEIGQTVANTASFVQHVNNISGELKEIAGGNLSVKIEKLSDADVLGGALLQLEDGLNNMFQEIHSVTGQVSGGSKQIADGAQTLAQGSTEQAATVQELSASSSEIAEKTKANSEMANKAASLATVIKDNAEKGSRQMDEMMSAVNEINQASQSISQVIKVIDNIAFQTNILALNAAVEAARAGQHGKGFAVVADEVRNLAAKSADAAKDTGELISNSMIKAEYGARIAKETAESLDEIVSGIKESTEIIGRIANSSEAQTTGITQIHDSIDQVAQVVQQNSATAEESAAVSEELSGQSALLEQLISRFKLKNSGVMPIHRAIMPAVPDTTAFALNSGYEKY